MLKGTKLTYLPIMKMGPKPSFPADEKLCSFSNYSLNCCVTGLIFNKNEEMERSKNLFGKLLMLPGLTLTHGLSWVYNSWYHL